MLKDLLILALIGAAAWFGYTHFEGRIRQALGFAPPARVQIPPEQFACDARIYCSQMTSCEEARYFVRYCPNGARLDRDDSGPSCEKRWCK